MKVHPLLFAFCLVVCVLLGSYLATRQQDIALTDCTTKGIGCQSTAVLMIPKETAKGHIRFDIHGGPTRDTAEISIKIVPDTEDKPPVASKAY